MENFYSCEQIAERYGVHVVTVWRWIRKAELPAIKIGRQYFITHDADNETMLKSVVEIMAQPIPWAQGLPLGAEGWVGTFFKKD